MNQVYSILQIEKGHLLNLKLIYLKFLDITFFFHNTFKTPCLKGIFGEIWNMVIPAYSDIVCDLEYGERGFSLHALQSVEFAPYFASWGDADLPLDKRGVGTVLVLKVFPKTYKFA